MQNTAPSSSPSETEPPLPESGLPPPSSPARIVELDGIRGIAIFLVLLSHLVPFFELHGIPLWQKFVLRTWSAGWVGVDVFFVLSGYLITNILVGGVNKPEFWRKFYIRRALRIMPAFSFAFALALVLTPAASPTTIFLYSAFLGNWTILGKQIELIGPVWSLAIEEQFYFVWPQIVARLSRKQLLRTAIGIAALSEILRLVFFLCHIDGWVSYNVTFTRLDGLAVGAALALATLDERVISFLKRHGMRVALIAAGFFAAGFVALGLSYFPWDQRAQLLAIPAVCVLTAMGIFLVLIEELPARLKKLLSNRFLAYLGLRSYGIYLIHTFVFEGMKLFLVRDLHLPAEHGFGMGMLIAASAIAASVIIAELSWRIVEQPAQRLRGFFKA